MVVSFLRPSLRDTCPCHAQVSNGQLYKLARLAAGRRDHALGGLFERGNNGNGANGNGNGSGRCVQSMVPCLGACGGWGWGVAAAEGDRGLQRQRQRQVCNLVYTSTPGRTPSNHDPAIVTPLPATATRHLHRPRAEHSFIAPAPSCYSAAPLPQLPTSPSPASQN